MKKTNQKDKEGLQHGLWTHYCIKKGITVEADFCHYIHGFYHSGVRFSCYESGVLQSKYRHIGGKTNGVSVSYHENGNIGSERMFVMGWQVGVSKLYFDNGLVDILGYFDHGISEGEYIEHDYE